MMIDSRADETSQGTPVEAETQEQHHEDEQQQGAQEKREEEDDDDEFMIDDERHGRVRLTPHVHYLYERDRRSYVPQRTPEWYARRRAHLTASQVSSACGENPYETSRTALMRKVGTEPDFQGNAATEHGNKYEDVAIAKYEKLTGRKVISFGLMESLNEREEWLAGSPDGITTCGRLIEVKCPYRRIPNGEVPKHYVHQIQTLMHILKIEVCDFIEFVPEGIWQEEILSIVEVRRDHYFWWRIFPKLVRFWSEVEQKRAAGAEALQEELLREEEHKAAAKERRAAKRVLNLTPCLIESPFKADASPEPKEEK